MSRQLEIEERRRRAAGEGARGRLLAALPVRERRLQLAGISTAVLEGGEGPPVVLLHEQGAFAASWMRVIPALMTTHRVVAPDLPGHGASEVTNGKLDADRVFAWLGELIEHTCQSPPAVVGHMGGGAVAARFAIAHRHQLGRLVLVDTFGLAKFRPSPRFAVAVMRYVTRPNRRTYEALMQRCTVDFDGVREDLGDRWEPFEAYTLDRVRAPSGKAALRVFMRELALPVISPADLARIAVPTTLIWGRRDPAMRLRIAEAASARYGWPLHIVEHAGDDPAFEQPEVFLRALRAGLAPVGEEDSSPAPPLFKGATSPVKS